jgi:hypothetical protein
MNADKFNVKKPGREGRTGRNELMPYDPRCGLTLVFLGVLGGECYSGWI